MKESELFDRLTPEARKALAFAREEAQRFNHNFIGTEHLLLGLVRLEASVATTALANLGVELEKVRSAVEFIIGRGDRIVLGEIGLTPRGKKVLELALDEARLMQQEHVAPEHLLLGLVREGEGIAAGVLESLGVNLWKVRQETYRVLGLPQPASDLGASPRPEAGPQVSWSGPSAFSFVAGQPSLPAVPSLLTQAGLIRHYRPWHIDAAQPEKTAVGNGAPPSAVFGPMFGGRGERVFGTLLGWVVVNTGGAFTLTLYDGLAADAPSLAIFHHPPTGAYFPFHCHVKQGLAYTLEGTPGSVTIIYDEAGADGHL
ncbi:MAG TPA: Clp protease N-terminal domain-containing protein [Ktedonobacterales bacterium]|jgi:hypothetical protein